MMKHFNSILTCKKHRKKRMPYIVFICLALMFSNFAFTQSVGSIKGKIIDSKTGEILIGTTLIIKGKKLHTISDIDGNYSISNVPVGSNTIICSFIGYKSHSQKVKIVSGQVLTLDINLKIDMMRIEEVVVTGIGSKNSKGRATVAVQRLDVEELTKKASYNSVESLLSGKVAGVSIQKSTAGFGASTRFVVRSGGGISGNGQPLIFVDGVRLQNTSFNSARGEGGAISSLVGLNPEDIANIEVIKGPAGSASYGTGAANGVILITTKRGRGIFSEKWEIRYKGTTGFHDMRDIKETEFRNFDYMNKKFFKTGEIIKHNFSISGGNEVLSAFFSADKNKEDGHTNNNDFKQTNVRLNLDFRPTSKLNIRTSLQYNDTDISFPQRGRGTAGGFGFLAFTRTNYDPAFAGTLKPDFYKTQSDKNNIRGFIGSLSTQYKPFADSDNALSGLTGNIVIGIVNQQNTSKFLQKKTTVAIEGEFNLGSRLLQKQNTNSFTLTSNISFDYELGKFRGTSSIGSQIFEDRNTGSTQARTNFSSGFITAIQSATINGTNDESLSHFKSAGIFTSHNFSYNAKFLATLMMRRDYASILGSLESSIIYPAASFAIRWDEFEWMPESFSILKTRIAYGETGSLPGVQDGIRYLWVTSNSQYGVGGVLSSNGNPNLKPERIKQVEFGLDAEIGNFGFELTYYKENATQSIVGKPNIPSSGLGGFSPRYNIGSVKGSGFETQINANFAGKALSGWRLNIGLTGAYQKNTVTDMGGNFQIAGGAGGGVQVYRAGFPKGAYLNNVTVGAKFDASGKYVSNIDSGENLFIGTNDPKYTGSLSLNLSVGNFSLYALTEFKTGFYLYNEQVIDQIGSGNDTAFFGGIGTNYYRYDYLSDQLGLSAFGTGATVLKVGTQEYKNVADQFAAISIERDANAIQPGDFLKIREVSLTYNFKDFIKKSKFIKDLTIGVTGSNLFNWFKREASLQTVTTLSGKKVQRWIAGFSGLDTELNSLGFGDGPQSGLQSGALPPSRTFTSFISLKF